MVPIGRNGQMERAKDAGVFGMIVMALIGCAWLVREGMLQAAWILTMVLVAGFIGYISWRITARWDGFLINENNRMDLGRLQLVLWTVVILSSFLSAAFYNIFNGHADPLGIVIPPQVWLLIGIDTTVTVGSTIASNTKNQPGKDGLYQKADPSLARFSDVFKGDGRGNYKTVDITKVQMFFFTILLIIAYAVLIRETFLLTIARIDALPGLDEGMLTLLAISNGGFLANQAIDHPETDTMASRKREDYQAANKKIAAVESVLNALQDT